MQCAQCAWVCNAVEGVQRTVGFCAMSAILSTLVATLIFGISVGLGVGYNHCFVIKQTEDVAKLRALDQVILKYTGKTTPAKRWKKIGRPWLKAGDEEAEETSTTITATTQTITTTEQYDIVTHVFAGWAGEPFKDEFFIITPTIPTTLKHRFARAINKGTVTEEFVSKMSRTPVFLNMNMSDLISKILSRKRNINIHFVRT